MPKEAEPHMFKKGDPRINRNGRPRKSDMLKDALLEKWDAPVIGNNGNPILDADGIPLTHGGEVIAKMFKDSKLYPELLNRAFGKVKDETEHSGDVTIKVEYGQRDNG